MKKLNKSKNIHAQQISSNARKNGLGKHATSDSQYQGFSSEMSIVSDNSTPILMEGIRGKVFMDRYALRAKDGTHIETTPEEMWKRVAWGISQAEKPAMRQEWEQRFYDVMKGFKFVPGGRILSGAGTGYQVTYFNCFVIPSPKDSRDGIIDSLKQLVEIQSRSGGVGLNLSSLRPKGSRVKKVNGFSSGPVTWAGLFSYATHDVVQQGGSRRGATMLMLHDWHPDIEEFITVKQDLSKINGANLSVCVSDGFMEAVKKDADWDLVYPDLDHPRYDELWSGDLEEWKAAGGTVKVAKTVKAKYLWDLICEAAWRSAEPGLHFLERSNARSNTWYFERLVCTNPCTTGDTLVATADGWRRVDQIKVGDQIGTVLGTGLVDRIETHENQPVFLVKFSDGAEIKVTAAHQFHAIKASGRAKNSANKHFTQISLSDLEIGDVARIAPSPMPDHAVADLPEGWSEKDYGFFIGMLLGDGCITEKSLNRNVVKVAINTAEKEWTEIVKAILQKTGSKFVSLDQGFGLSANLTMQSMNGAATIVRDSFLKPSYSYEKFIPLEYQNTNRSFLAGLIDGLFSTDGNVNLTTSHPQLRFKTTSKQLAQDLRRILLCFGIHGHIATLNRVKDGLINGRVIVSKHQQYEVIISGHGIKTFSEQIGLSHPDKQKRLRQARQEFALTGNTWLTRITSIEVAGFEKVYDLHEPESDTWITEGVVSRGCGEQPLGPWAVCNLGAMNLSAYVTESHSPDGEARFDFESFGQDVKVAMRLMDNVIDQTYYFFPENEDCAKNIRRTGLGIMGLADALIKMKLRYGSPESEPVIRQIFQTLRDSAYEASADNAKEKGSFPLFDKEKYLQGYHIKQLPEPIRAKIATQGIRNAVLLTIAPTGTTSLVSGVSSGVEPVYEFSFLRRWRGGEEIIYHPLFDEWRKANPGSQKPDYFASANDLTPMEHVKVQAIAQEYIDSSISKTVNAPNNHTVDDVQNLYMAAYDMGLKGITYMRDGSRQGVLERVEEKKTEVKVEPVVPAPVHRPMVLRGRTYKVTTPLGEGFITINRDDKDQPFEVFITVSKGGSHTMADAEALGRLISMTLRFSGDSRHEVAQKIVQQLRGIGGSSHIGFGKDRVMSLADAIAKVLAEDMAITEAEKPEQAPLSLEEPQTEPILHTNGLGTHKTEVDHLTLPETPEQMPMLTLSPRETLSGDLCPECGNSTFVMEEGCQKCYSCGYSKC